MSGLADVAFAVGAQQGMRARTKERKLEGEHDEDRSLALARNAKTDAFTDEARAHTQDQWKQQDTAATNTSEAAKLKLDEQRQRVQDEGALDFLYEIDAGGDPTQAMQRHNSVGRSKMVDGSVQVHQDPEGNKRVSFDMDSEGDGNVKHFDYDVGKTIGALEQITGKNAKDRYLNVPDGGNVFDRRKGVIVASNPKDLTSAAANRPKTHVVGHSLVDDNGKVVFTDRGAGGAGATGVTKFNPQTYSTDVTNSLGRLMGGKYDTATGQFDYGNATKKMTELNRIAQREAQRLIGANGAITAPMIATVVAQQAQDFDPDAIREKVRAEVEAHPSAQTNEEGKFFGLGKVKPDVLKKLQDDAVQSAVVEIGVRTRIALDSEYQRLGSPDAPMGSFDGEPGAPPADDEAETRQEVAAAAGGDGGDAAGDDFVDPTTTAADYLPAVQPGAAPPARSAPAQRKPGDAGDWPADAPPRDKIRALKRGQGLKKGNVIWFVDENGKLQKKAASGK